MDNSVILKLVFDGTCYADNIKIVDNEEFKENDKAFWDICENLLKDLPEQKKKEVSNKIFLALGGMGSVYADEYFKAGFKLGLTIGAQNFLD